MGIFGTSLAEATNPAIAALGSAAVPTPGGFEALLPLYGPAQLSDVSAGATGLFGGASLGSLLGGVGAGFGVGSLAGGSLQDALGKTGPAPTIGAGLGAAAGVAAAALAPETLGLSLLAGGLLGGHLGRAAGGVMRSTP